MDIERDPNGIHQHEPGSKLDQGKPLPWLCIAGFARALAAVADVTTKGARKYTPNGWAYVLGGEERYMEAFSRHMLALGKGERFDLDTGCLHKAQMAWNILASLELELRTLEKQAEQVIQKRDWADEQQRQHELGQARNQAAGMLGQMRENNPTGAIASAGYGVPTGVIPR